MKPIRPLVALCAAALWTSAAAAPPPGTAFPQPARPVADIVSPSWGDPPHRDAAREAPQIAERLKLRPGMTVADIGAGSGYDTLRLSPLVGPRGTIVAEDVTPGYLQALKATVQSQRLGNVRTVLGAPDDARLPPGSIDAAIMIHMYHEIRQPYALLYTLAPAFRPGGRLGIEELDQPTPRHGTPPALLTCELQAVGYRRLSLAPLQGGLGYFAVFAPPAPGARPAPDRIKPCKG